MVQYHSRRKTKRIDDQLVPCLLLVACLPLVRGFSRIAFTRHERWSPVALESRTFMSKEVPEHRESPEEKATLVLKGEYLKESDTAPKCSPMEMMGFFQKAETQECLVSAGHRLEVEIVNSTVGLQEKWIERASLLGACEPEVGDVMLSVKTGGLQLPGLTISTVATVGSKLIPPDEISLYPCLEFITIDDATVASGLAPVVWIFNQLTGAGKKDSGDRTSATSISRCSVKLGDGEGEIRFKTAAFLEIQINFPALLLRIIPVSKEKAEQQGADAIVKALSSDIDRALSALHKTYCSSVEARELAK